MPRSKDLGRFFVLTIKVQSSTPPIHIAPTFEIEPPFRICRRCVIVRLWPTDTALVFGWWRESGLVEDEALRQALSVRIVDLDEPADLDLNDRCHRRTVRDNIAAQVDDIEDEWRLLAMLGLEQDEVQ